MSGGEMKRIFFLVSCFFIVLSLSSLKIISSHPADCDFREKNIQHCNETLSKDDVIVIKCDADDIVQPPNAPMNICEGDKDCVLDYVEINKLIKGVKITGQVNDKEGCAIRMPTKIDKNITLSMYCVPSAVEDTKKETRMILMNIKASNSMKNTVHYSYYMILIFMSIYGIYNL